jgi:hypothetical protein
MRLRARQRPLRSILLGMTASDRLAPPVADPVYVDDEEHFFVERVVKKAEAEKVALAAIKESMLRPADIEASSIEDMQLGWVPLWRFDLSIRGFHLGLSRGGGRTLPTGGHRHRDAVKLVLARRLFAYDPTPKLKIAPAEMRPCNGKRPPGGEVVHPDVSRDDAEHEAKEAMRRGIEPQNALFSTAECDVRSVAFVQYPLMIVRYTYAGEAKADAAPELCHVAVSGRTGKIVSAHHPSTLRALGSKLRRLFT